MGEEEEVVVVAMGLMVLVLVVKDLNCCRALITVLVVCLQGVESNRRVKDKDEEDDRERIMK